MDLLSKLIFLFHFTGRLLLKEFDMDKINEFLNHKLPDDFILSDDEVMDRLQLCIDKLTRFKFQNGPLLEPIPESELPKIPFGEYKKFDKQEIISQIVQKSNEKVTSKTRDAAVEQLAKDRLETEKKKKEEKRRKREENSETLSYGKMINDGGPILNISDEEDYDNENMNETDDDEDDDDLNPSKLSEYDDDKIDKESMLSNLTRESTPQRSFTDIQSQLSLEMLSNPAKNTPNSDSLRKNLLNIKQSQTKSSFLHQNSEYENVSITNNSLSKSFINRQSTYENHNINEIIDRKTPTQSPKSTKTLSRASAIQENSSTSNTTTNTIINNPLLSPKYSPKHSPLPSSHSYASTATIKSIPPPISPSSFISHSNHVSSILTNPGYYVNSNNTSPKVINNGNYEYVRSPHGIYTRVNVPPYPNNDTYNRSKLIQNNVIYTQIPQSTSTYIMSTRAANLSPVVNKYASASSSNSLTNKRTSSLRNGQKTNPQNGVVNLNNSNSASKLNYIRVQNNVNTTNNSNVNINISNTNGTTSSTATKQQLENHSMRIASIQQQQQQQQQQVNGLFNTVGANNHYPTISIISQAPKPPPAPSTPNFNHNHLHSHYTNVNKTPTFLRSSSATRPSSTINNNNSSLINNSNKNNTLKSSNNSNSNKISKNEEIIEQYDYI